MSNPQSKQSRGRSGRTGHLRSYPRSVGVDFRKLPPMTLLQYVDHNNISVRTEASSSELAVSVARHFELMEVDEESCIGDFLSRLDNPSSSPFHPHRPLSVDAPSFRRRRHHRAARPGEQVAAKVTRTEENGSWILASVQRYYPETETYDVHDDDDPDKVIRLPYKHVMRLSCGSEGTFPQHADCMAIFPETTSFYRARVSQRPVWGLYGTTQMIREVVVKFEDDEDDYGRTPNRRVPSRYVIPLPAEYFYDENEDVNLQPIENTK